MNKNSILKAIKQMGCKGETADHGFRVAMEGLLHEPIRTGRAPFCH
jgi:hypothetical protein